MNIITRLTLIALFLSSAAYASEETTFMGMDAAAVMVLSGPRIGPSYPCSSQYNRGSIANKWCHGAIAKAIKFTLEDKGINTVVSHGGGLAVLALWETTNKRFDRSDIITAPIEMELTATTRTAVSFDLSGGVIVYLSYDF